jgi:hypothetical protein
MCPEQSITYVSERSKDLDRFILLPSSPDALQDSRPAADQHLAEEKWRDTRGISIAFIRQHSPRVPR